jgi:hypothetical protein
VPEAKIIHYETSEGAKLVHPEGGTDLTKNYYLARNHLLFVERNAPFSVQLRETLRLPKTLWEHFKKGDRSALKGIKDYLLRKYFQQHDKSRTQTKSYTHNRG